MPDFPVNIRALEKLLEKMGGPDGCKQAVVRYCSGERGALLEEAEQLMHLLHYVWDGEILNCITLMTHYYNQQHSISCSKTIVAEFRKAEPLRTDKLGILARHGAFYKLADEIKKLNLVGPNKFPKRRKGSKGVFIGAVHVMMSNHYFMEYMYGKKVKLTDIMKFISVYFEVDNLEELKRHGDTMDKYRAKAYAWLDTLTTNEQKH